MEKVRVGGGIRNLSLITAERREKKMEWGKNAGEGVKLARGTKGKGTFPIAQEICESQEERDAEGNRKRSGVKERLPCMTKT